MPIYNHVATYTGHQINVISWWLVGVGFLLCLLCGKSDLFITPGMNLSRSGRGGGGGRGLFWC